MLLLTESVALQTQKQLRLFSLRDPLTERFGADYFRALPQVPGVYFFYGKQGELLYIGQSLDLRARVGSYRHVTPEKNPKRTLRLVYRIARIEWQVCATAAEAIELERVLLLEHRPPFNRAGVWLGDPWWLKVEPRAEKVHLHLTREEAVIGPLPSGFRFILGSLIRVLHRLSFPELPISAYPHGVFGMQVPLNLALFLPEVEAAAQVITDYAQGKSAEFLARLVDLPLGASLTEQEYWLEEIEGLKRYAAKIQRAEALQKRQSNQKAGDEAFGAELDFKWAACD